MKRLLIFILSACTFSTHAQTTIYSENFNSGTAAGWTLNTSDLGGTTGTTADNQWIVNNSYSGLVGTTPSEPSGITGYPNSYYLHITGGSLYSSLGTNDWWEAAGPTNSYFTKMSTVVTTGYTSVNLNFWWLCNGIPAKGNVYYRTSSSGSWTLITTPITNYSGSSSWALQTIHLAAFDNEPYLEFGFQFTEDAVGNYPGFGIDDVSVTGTSSTTTGVAPITGTLSMCVGGTSTLADATIGGTWSSSSTSVATVSSSGVVSGISTGTATISYVATSGTATAVVTVNPNPGTISGTSAVCQGSTSTLTDAPSGGTWTSSSAATATVDASSGIVTGVAPGVSTISYTLAFGCYATTAVTVNANPAAISGVPAVCPGGTSPLTDATPGGTWSSSATSIATVGSSSGVLAGVTSGSAIITYALPTGCYDTMSVTVSTVPPITVSGSGAICVGATTTLSHSVPGGTWSSSSTAIAAVGSATGVVTGVANGTVTISYTFGTSGCYATTTITVIGTPAVTGGPNVCVGHTDTLSAMPAGGTWSSSNITKATIGSSSGVVTGIAAGTTIIKYKVTTACGTDSTTLVMTVLSAANCHTGTAILTAEPSGLNVYPNPNNGTFTLRLATDESEDVHIIVTNLLGKTVKEFNTTTNKAENITLDQPAGIYLFSAITALEKYDLKVLIE